MSVIGGVDTHKHTHYAAVLDGLGRLLGHEEFPATDRGYRKLLAWMASHGQISAIGVETQDPSGQR
nr:transposase [Pseudonocardia sp. ICBG1142]